MMVRLQVDVCLLYTAAEAHFRSDTACSVRLGSGVVCIVLQSKPPITAKFHIA